MASPRHRRAATATEFGLIAALIAIVIVAGLTILGKELRMSLAFAGMAVGDGPPPQWFLAEVWPEVHGGDEQVTVTEYISARSQNGQQEQYPGHFTNDFNNANTNGGTFLDFNEWVAQGSP